MPHVIDGRAAQRIARGCGTNVQQVNQLLAARKEMEKMMKQMGKGKMPGSRSSARTAPPRRAAADALTSKPKSKGKRKKEITEVEPWQ